MPWDPETDESWKNIPYNKIKTLKEVKELYNANQVGAEATYPQITICEIWEEKTEDVSSNKNPLNLHELELI